MNPLDMPGPEFLGFYFVALVIAGVVALVLRAWARGPFGELDDGTLESLHPYELGYLRAGVPGAVQTAAAALMHRGRVATKDLDLVLVKAKRKRQLVAAGVYRDITHSAPEHPLERAVVMQLEGVGGRSSYRSVVDACRVAAGSLEDRLVSLGLLRGSGRNWLVRLPVAAVLALGGAKLAVGMWRERPICFLGVLIGVGALLLFIRAKERRSRRGDAALATLEGRNAALHDTAREAPQQLTDDEIALAAGLFGAAALGGPLADIVPKQPPGAATAAAGFASCGASCGVSCGASCGGGCGGGCGGCGG